MEGGTIILHNRRMPGGRGDIHHIAVVPSGVYVFGTKDVTGKVQIANPLFSKPKLLINGRDCPRYLVGLGRQVSAVRAA